MDEAASESEADDAEPEDVDSDVVVGEIVAVPASGDDDQRPFHLLLVTHAPEILTEPVANSCFRYANGRPSRFLRGARVVRCNWLAPMEHGMYELWDAAWVSNGKWAGAPPWPEVPEVVVDTASIKAVGIELIAVGDAVQRRLKDTNPGKLFTLPDAELEDLIDKFEG